MISLSPVRLLTIHVQTIKMKSLLLFVLTMLTPVGVAAAEDPILFMVGDMPVTRTEFEQSYLKMIGFGQAPQSVADYLESYIVYKLKVKAALDAHIDATSAFKAAYAQSVSANTSVQQTVAVTSTGRLTAPASSVNAQYEELRRRAGADGLICLSQIFFPVAQKASREEQRQAQQRMERIYHELQQGADFGQLARQYSQDESSAQNGGEMGWFSRGQLFKEIEDAAFGMKKGEMSRPLLSTIGYHILLLKDRKQLARYDALRGDLAAEAGHRQIHQLTTTAPLQGDIIERQEATVVVSDVQMPSDPLQREYYEGLLLFEQSKQSVGRHAAEDEEALKYFFKKNKKKYRRKGFKPKDYTEVRELVVADLQEEMNKHWVADLRKQYPVRIDKKVLKTVNKHH